MKTPEGTFDFTIGCLLAGVMAMCVLLAVVSVYYFIAGMVR